ncbi:MAG: type III-B CRISPR-associated protein Cas10/Cmr2, partial [Deltaproteobacteria bacterium]|nr:type III-B CRISPR-associated protein Cas10/Cmr2 [Deltaproteobacteria bacterium]
MNWFRNDASYWNRKISLYLHDPPDKALCIPGYQRRSEALLEALDLTPISSDLRGAADGIASGMDRSLLPDFAEDPQASSSIDFLSRPVLTHPCGKVGSLSLSLSSANIRVEDGKILDILHRDLGTTSGENGLLASFRDGRDGYAAALFHYLHHVLRIRLAQENIGKLKSLWYRIPADPRIPDHSIWQHCGLVSALGSCFDLSRESRASIMVFNITPVQSFISQARKLRDYWMSSLILSWLVFEGIRQIIYRLGSDHILYPSLQGQPLVNWLLRNECHLTWLENGLAEGVASFPNKFVFLAPSGQEKEMAETVSDFIKKQWGKLGEAVIREIEECTGHTDSYMKKQFQRQMEHFWNFRWAALPLLREDTPKLLGQLLPISVWEEPLDLLMKVRGFYPDSSAEGTQYGVSHMLVQRFLAAGKSRLDTSREDEPGIKCNIMGDYEALRWDWMKGEDRNPRPNRDPFWSAFKDKWWPKSDFKPSERLCSLALIKRLSHQVLRRRLKDGALAELIKNENRFPSTTEIALTDWLSRVAGRELHKALGTRWRSKLAQYVHEMDEEKGPEILDIEDADRRECQKIFKEMKKVKDPMAIGDRYYAILLMDGDHMGRLVGGETIAATWNSVLHPELTEKLSDPGFPSRYQDFLKERLNDNRGLSPAVHASISESLGDFSLNTVPRIIHHHQGRLIYAGGDDVMAVLPVSTALQAARDIAEAYCWGFVYIPSDPSKAPCPLEGSWTPAAGRLAVHLGGGPRISISAAVLITHHKRPLSAAIHRVHDLLKDEAKKKGGRNALALELDRRAGGSRTWVVQWDAGMAKAEETKKDGKTLIDSFLEISRLLGADAGLSAGLAYRLSELEPSLLALMDQAPEKLKIFVAKQVLRSGGQKKGDEEKALLSAA